MAEIFHSPGIDKMLGLHGKGGLVERQKHFHDYEGRVTKVGKLEGFYVKNPRDFKHNPPLARERANMQAFGSASHLAKELIDALKNGTALPPEKQALLDDYKARFYRQLKGKPDVIAPKNRNGEYTIYARIDNFIRACIRKESPTL